MRGDSRLAACWRMAVAALRAFWRRRPELLTRQATAPSAEMNDGEAQILHTPREDRIHHRALRVLVPARQTEAGLSSQDAAP